MLKLNVLLDEQLAENCMLFPLAKVAYIPAKSTSILITFFVVLQHFQNSQENVYLNFTYSLLSILAYRAQLTITQ